MKITLLALHLGFGGIEKYITTIANILCDKYEVEIISTYKTTQKPAFYLSPKVKVTYLIEGLTPNREQLKEARQKKKIFSILKQVVISMKILYFKNKENKRAIKECKSDIIISTREYHNEMIQKYASKKIIKIATEHNHPNGNEKYANRVVNSCYGFDYLLPISKELVNFYKEKLKKTEVQVIYIPFCIEEPENFKQPTFNDPTYISVGRLSPEKGSLELISLFSKLKKEQSNAKLHIIGDGALMNELKLKVKQEGLEKGVQIHGFLDIKNIYELYAQSSIYLMTSYTESFGFVLLEAMVNGLPCIAFDSAQGANEIIENGFNGYLIKDRDTNEFIRETILLFSDKKKMKSFSINARKKAEEYSFNRTKSDWLNLVKEINSKFNGR